MTLQLLFLFLFLNLLQLFINLQLLTLSPRPPSSHSWVFKVSTCFPRLWPVKKPGRDSSTHPSYKSGCLAASETRKVSMSLLCFDGIFFFHCSMCCGRIYQSVSALSVSQLCLLQSPPQAAPFSCWWVTACSGERPAMKRLLARQRASEPQAQQFHLA